MVRPQHHGHRCAYPAFALVGSSAGRPRLPMGGRSALLLCFAVHHLARGRCPDSVLLWPYRRGGAMRLARSRQALATATASARASALDFLARRGGLRRRVETWLASPGVARGLHTGATGDDPMARQHTFGFRLCPCLLPARVPELRNPGVRNGGSLSTARGRQEQAVIVAMAGAVWPRV